MDPATALLSFYTLCVVTTPFYTTLCGDNTIVVPVPGTLATPWSLLRPRSFLLPPPSPLPLLSPSKNPRPLHARVCVHSDLEEPSFFSLFAFLPSTSSKLPSMSHTSCTLLKLYGSLAAMSANTFRSNSTLDTFSPCMNSL
jgi:hypothetical protein